MANASSGSADGGRFRAKNRCVRVFHTENGILSTANPQYRKCANALLASAILWVSSFFLNAPPVLFLASMISAAKRSAMVFSPLVREKATSQRRPSV